MALRTAPCPQCQTVIVFGERSCRTCGLVFNYGAKAPPEPTEAEIFDALLSAQPASAPAPRPPLTPPARPSTPTPMPPSMAPSTPPRQQTPEPPTATLAGLDTGRFSVGEVEIDDVPGLIDSSLFRSLTPDHVDVAPIPGLEVNRVDVGDVGVRAIDVDTGRAAAVGEVAGAAIPGLYGSDMFATDVDIAAGAERSPSLEVSHIRATKKKDAVDAVDEDDLRRAACLSCGTMHARTRCPACATPHPDLMPE